MLVTSSHTVSYKSNHSLHHKDPHYLHLHWGWTFILCGMLNGCICHKAIAVHRLFGKFSGQNYQKMHKTVSNSSRNVHICLRFDWPMPPNCLKPKWILIINYSNVEFSMSRNVRERVACAKMGRYVATAIDTDVISVRRDNNQIKCIYSASSFPPM